MDIRTHLAVNRELCGTPMRLGPGSATVELATTRQMAADDSGLVHGGFVFGMADFAAMIAVNHPNVVLASSESRFLKPVRAGERLLAEANVSSEKGKWRTVDVRVTRGEDAVFQGVFSCVVPERHVLGAG
jgi:acyl-coenzyme A thioesterase PaaI-like protein